MARNITHTLVSPYFVRYYARHKTSQPAGERAFYINGTCPAPPRGLPRRAAAYFCALRCPREAQEGRAPIEQARREIHWQLAGKKAKRDTERLTWVQRGSDGLKFVKRGSDKRRKAYSDAQRPREAQRGRAQKEQAAPSAGCLGLQLFPKTRAMALLLVWWQRLPNQVCRHCRTNYCENAMKVVIEAVADDAIRKRTNIKLKHCHAQPDTR